MRERHLVRAARLYRGWQSCVWMSPVKRRAALRAAGPRRMLLRRGRRAAGEHFRAWEFGLDNEGMRNEWTAGFSK